MVAFYNLLNHFDKRSYASGSVGCKLMSVDARQVEKISYILCSSL